MNNENRDTKHRLCMIVTALLFAVTAVPGRTQDATGPFCTGDEESADVCRKAVFEKLRPGAAVGVDLAPDLSQGKTRYLKNLALRLDPERASEVAAFPIAMLPLVNLASSAETNKTDFKSPFSLLIGSGSLTDDGETFKVDLGEALGLPTRVRLVANLRPPEVYAPLKMAFEEAKLSTELDALEDGLDDFSDVSIEVKINFSKSKNLADENRIRDLFEQMFSAAGAEELLRPLKEAAREAAREAKDLRDNWIADQIAAGVAFNANDEPVGETIRKRFIEHVEAVAVAEAAYLNQIDKPLRERGFFRLGELVANQPQWVFEAEVVRRDDAAGPDEVRGSLSYEIGFPNALAYQRKCFDEKDLYTCYNELLEKAGPKVEKGNRLSFKVEFADIDIASFTLPDSDVGIGASTDESLIVAASYGRNFAFDHDRRIATRRIDFTVDHEETDKDSMRNSRQKVGVTLTQRLTDETSLSFGAVWASDPEFRGDVDHEVSARFGLSYKFLDGKKDKGKKG